MIKILYKDVQFFNRTSFKMFNKEEKFKYIMNSKDENEYRYNFVMFLNTFETEKSLGKDICDFTYKELYDMICKFNIRDMLVNIKLLEKYLNYYGKNELASQISVVDPSDVKGRLTKRKIITYNEYQYLIKDIYENQILDKRSAYVAAMLILLYKGVKLEALNEATMENIKIENEIEKEILRVAKSLTGFENDNIRGRNVLLDTTKEEVICKPHANDRKQKTLHQYYLRFFNKYMGEYGYDTVYNLSPNTLNKSGQLYLFVNECNKSGLNVNEELHCKKSKQRLLFVEIGKMFDLDWDNTKKFYTSQMLEIYEDLL